MFLVPRMLLAYVNLGNLLAGRLHTNHWPGDGISYSTQLRRRHLELLLWQCLAIEVGSRCETRT